MARIELDFVEVARKEVAGMYAKGAVWNVQPADRDDMVQMAAIGAWKCWDVKLCGQRTPSEQYAFVRCAARCAALSYLRHRAVRLREVPTAGPAMEAMTAVQDTPEGNLYAAQCEQRIAQVMGATLEVLSPTEREWALDSLGWVPSQRMRTGVHNGTRSALRSRALDKLQTVSKELQCQDIFDEHARGRSFA